MALENGNGNGGIPATMLVGPAGLYGNGGGFGGYGNDWFVWILFALLFGGGWGFGGMGGWGGMMGMGMMDGFGLYPWLNNSQNINNGFRDQFLNDNIIGIRDAITNGFATAEASANARQIADMQQAFAMQQQFSNCCCEQRLGVASLGADIAREACATRTNDTQNTQAILNVVNSGIQSIKDQLCQDKIDEKNDLIAQLRQENLYARGQASQIEQTARILAGQAAEIDGVYNRLKDCPVGTVPVFGSQPIFTCGGSSCGGCSGNAFVN